MGDGEKLFTHLNSALKVLLGLDIFPRVPKKTLNFVDQCNKSSLKPARSLNPSPHDVSVMATFMKKTHTDRGRP